MTQPLNYTTKAIEALNSMAETAAPFSRHGFRYIADLLRRAEVFVLPEKGQLIERNKPRPHVAGSIFRPPFPVVALEYPNVIRGDPHPIYECSPTSRHISLAWLWDGRLPNGIVDPSTPIGESVAVASIAFYDQPQMWCPVPGAVLIPFDCQYATPPDTPFRRAMVEQGRLNAKMAAEPAIVFSEMIVLMPEVVAELKKQKGERGALDLINADITDELNAYMDLCLALACNNVRTEKHAQPEKLNRARIKRGELPLKDFHVLSIAGHGEGEGFGGAGHGGVRSHLRRGHIRRLGPERITWVNATMVRGSRPGFVDKQYAPRVVS